MSLTSHCKYALALLLLMFLLPSGVFSNDHLTPCYNTFAGYGIRNEYLKEIRKVFIDDLHLFGGNPSFVMISLPSFKPEEMVVVYESKNTTYIASYVSNKSIWHYVYDKENGQSLKYKFWSGIKLKKYKRAANQEIAELLSKIYRSMVNGMCTESEPAAILDGTTFLFLADVGVCASTISPDITSLNGHIVDIGNDLHKYAMNQASDSSDLAKIVKKARNLLNDMNDK